MEALIVTTEKIMVTKLGNAKTLAGRILYIASQRDKHYKKKHPLGGRVLCWKISERILWGTPLP